MNRSDFLCHFIIKAIERYSDDYTRTQVTINEDSDLVIEFVSGTDGHQVADVVLSHQVIQEFSEPNNQALAFEIIKAGMPLLTNLLVPQKRRRFRFPHLRRSHHDTTDQGQDSTPF